jgi:hypothetical protein
MVATVQPAELQAYRGCASAVVLSLTLTPATAGEIHHQALFFGVPFVMVMTMNHAPWRIRLAMLESVHIDPRTRLASLACVVIDSQHHDLIRGQTSHVVLYEAGAEDVKALSIGG